MAMQRIQVRSETGTYTVVYGSGLTARAASSSVDAGHTNRAPKLGAMLRALGAHTGLFLISSPGVARHWQKKLEASLRRENLRATILFDDRESKKNMATAEQVCRALVRAGADRHALLVAAGGGVVGDVCGFVAAIYLRGVRLVHVPTTVVAQVDSSIGGKTGVNLPEGKNLVGAFYSPQLVLADPAMLATLSDREFRSGLYEVIKYGVIGDQRLFSFLEREMAALLRRDAHALDTIIPVCIRAKARIVSRDEREGGLREVLNFGHTFAHAFETATAYRRYLHGEAVGWGMIAAARLAVRTGVFSAADATRVEALVRLVGPLPPLPNVPPARLVAIMGSDKKTRAGKLRFVIPTAIGKADTVGGIPVKRVQKVLAELHTGVRPEPGNSK